MTASIKAPFTLASDKVRLNVFVENRNIDVPVLFVLSSLTNQINIVLHVGRKVSYALRSVLLFEHEKTCLSYLKTQCQCATTNFNSYVYHKTNREKDYLYQLRWVWKITCWHFDWMLQWAIVKEVQTNIATYSYALLRIHVIGGQRSVRIAPPVCTSFTFTLMTTGAFSRNVGKLFSKLKFVTDNFSLYVCSSQLRSH